MLDIEIYRHTHMHHSYRNVKRYLSINTLYVYLYVYT